MSTCYIGSTVCRGPKTLRFFSIIFWDTFVQYSLANQCTDAQWRGSYRPSCNFFFIEEIMHSQGCNQETSLMANIFFESVTMSCEKYLIFCNSLNVGLHKLTTKLHVYKMTDCSTWKENKLNTEKRVFFPTTLLVMVAPILVVRNLFQTS